MEKYKIPTDALYEAYRIGVVREEDLDKKVFNTKEKRRVALELLDEIRRTEFLGMVSKIGNDALKTSEKSIKKGMTFKYFN